MVQTILCTGQQKRHSLKVSDSAGEGEGGMIRENSIEAYTLPYAKQMTSVSLMHAAGHPKPVLWDNLEGQGGEGGGRGVQNGGEHVYPIVNSC